MEAKTSKLVLELPKPELNDKRLDELNELNSNYDLTKLLINKINALNKPTRPKSRSGSINEIPYSPTKCLTELNFYKTSNEVEQLDDPLDDDDDDDRTAVQMAQPSKQNADQIKADNPIGRLLQFRQVKQLNDLLNNACYSMPINLQEQFELDSFYSSSSEPNRGWQLDGEAFVLQCLNRHNYHRKLHQVPNLNLSKNVGLLLFFS